MTTLSAKKGKVWQPVRQQKTAEQRKNEELYGKSAVVYGTGKKKDGSLMANGADWRNLQQTHTNAAVQSNARNEEEGTNNPRGKKFENLQSHLFDNDET